MTKPLDTVEQIKEYFADWAMKPESERLDFIRNMRSKGQLSAVNPSRPSTDCCPIHNFQVARPCSLTGCTYNIASPSNKNCLFVAVAEAKNSRLNPDEIGGLLGIPLKEVNNQHTNAVKKIQQALIKESVDLERLPRFQYLKSHCVSCELYIRDEMDMGLHADLYYRWDNTYAWCSPKCRRTKPEHEFRIELEFGSDFKSVLKMAASLASLRQPTKSSTYMKIDQILDLDIGITERSLQY